MSLFGDLYEKTKSLWTAKGEEPVASFLGAGQVPEAREATPIAPDSAYVTVTLASLRLTRIRTGLTKFAPVVHSHLKLSHRRGTDAEFRCVTTPGGLMELDAAHLDRVVQANLPLLGPVPYRAGDIAAEIGLFSLKTADMLAPYLTLLGKVSETAGVSLIERAVPLGPLLADGLQLLTGGAGQQIVEVGYFGGLPARAGWFLLARAPRAEVDLTKLRVDAADHRLTVAGGGAPPWPYLLLRIEAKPTLDSWTDLPELFSRYQALTKAVEGGSEAEVKDTLAVFRRYALFACPDLLLNHARALVTQVTAQVNEAMGGGAAPMVLTSGEREARRMSAAAINPFR